MVLVRGKVNRAAKGVQQAPVNRSAFLNAAFPVEPLRVLTPKVRDLPNAEVPEVFGNALADAGDRLQFLDALFF